MANQKKAPNPAGKDWTILVWMAGDNDLQSFGESDLKEMKAVGSTDQVDIVVQFDRMSDSKTRRYHLRKGTSLAADEVAALGETNSGDPAVAVDFFSWGMANYPAARTLTVFWNHGSGIDEQDVYRGGRLVGRPVARRVARSGFSRSLFSSTLDKALKRPFAARGILYDDTNRDFLDNAEMKRVLTEVKKKSGKKIDLVGFDACLMSMVEVAYQLRESASYLVGSEEVEPGDGWPYTDVLTALNAKPGMTAAELGTTIVRRYLASYASEDVTQSAFDLAGATTFAVTLDRLADQLIAALKLPAEYAAITKALNGALRFTVGDYIDLYDFCDQLAQKSKRKALVTAAKATMAALGAGSGFLLAEGHKGSNVARAHGAAIYFPRGETAVAYDQLDFAKKTSWGEFIAAYQAA